MVNAQINLKTNSTVLAVLSVEKESQPVCDVLDWIDRVQEHWMKKKKSNRYEHVANIILRNSFKHNTTTKLWVCVCFFFIHTILSNVKVTNQAIGF